MPSPLRSPAHRTFAVLTLLLVPVLGACGSDGGDAATPAPTTAVATTPEASPVPTPTVTALPESVLEPIPEMTYRPPATPGVPAGMQESADWLGGYLSRTLLLKGKPVGTATVLRLATGLVEGEADARVAALVSSYLGGAAPATQTIAGVEVIVGERIRGTAAAVAIFRTPARDVVLLASPGGIRPTLTMTQLWLRSAQAHG